MNRDELKAKATREAMAFFKKNGFMDFTRFKKYFEKVTFKNEELRNHFLINWYCVLFGGLDND